MRVLWPGCSILRQIEEIFSAVGALGEIGLAATEAVPVLITALGDANTEVRRYAARTLGRIGPATAEVAPALTAALQDPPIKRSSKRSRMPVSGSNQHFRQETRPN
jgi:hypothetical protein